jgi:hypothetical protein
MDSSPANIAAIAANVGSTCSQYRQFVVSTNSKTFLFLFANVDANSLVLFVVTLPFMLSLLLLLLFDDEEDAPNRLLRLWLSALVVFKVPRPVFSSYRSFPVVVSLSMLSPSLFRNAFVFVFIFVVVFLRRRRFNRNTDDDPTSSLRPPKLLLLLLLLLLFLSHEAEDDTDPIDARVCRVFLPDEGAKFRAFRRARRPPP